MKVLAGVLVVVVAALVWAIYALNDSRRSAAAQQTSNEIVIVDFSNRLTLTRRELDEQKKVNTTLETNLTDRTRNLENLRVEIAALNTDLAKSRAETRTAQAETKTAQDEIVKRDGQIASLEGRNVDLTKQMGDLQTSIADLEGKINETERRLATSEGNRQELSRELKRLQDEKISLEKQLNDLAYLRDQVRKLKDELNVARRLDWIRRGIYSTQPVRKGAEVLNDMKFGAPAANATTAPTPGKVPSLDVELKRSGEVNVRSGAATNATAAPK
jgi:septal ring factor EnvC (AmiA/AmiB activator)